MKLIYILVAPFVGFVAGFAGTILGIGGGAIMVPVLTFAGLDIKTVIPASLFAILGTSLGGLKTLYKKKLVNIKLAVFLESASITGAVLGVEIFGRVGSSFLEMLLGTALIMSGILFLLKERKLKYERIKNPSIKKLLFAWVASLIAGFISATLGVGGGVVKVPILVLTAGLEIHMAVSTSKLMVGITALTGVIGHAVTERVDYLLAFLLLAGTYLGASSSAKIMIKIKPTVLLLITASYYFITGLSLIIASL